MKPFAVLLCISMGCAAPCTAQEPAKFVTVRLTVEQADALGAALRASTSPPEPVAGQIGEALDKALAPVVERRAAKWRRPLTAGEQVEADYYWWFRPGP